MIIVEHRNEATKTLPGPSHLGQERRRNTHQTNALGKKDSAKSVKHLEHGKSVGGIHRGNARQVGERD